MLIQNIIQFAKAKVGEVLQSLGQDRKYKACKYG